MTYGYYSLMNLCSVLLLDIHPVVSRSNVFRFFFFFICHVIVLMLRPRLLMNAGTKARIQLLLGQMGPLEKNPFSLLFINILKKDECEMGKLTARPMYHNIFANRSKE